MRHCTIHLLALLLLARHGPISPLSRKPRLRSKQPLLSYLPSQQNDITHCLAGFNPKNTNQKLEMPIMQSNVWPPCFSYCLHNQVSMHPGHGLRGQHAPHLELLVENIQDHIQGAADNTKQLAIEWAHNVGIEPRHWPQVIDQPGLKADNVALVPTYKLPPAKLHRVSANQVRSMLRNVLHHSWQRPFCLLLVRAPTSFGFVTGSRGLHCPSPLGIVHCGKECVHEEHELGKERRPEPRSEGVLPIHQDEVFARHCKPRPTRVTLPPAISQGLDIRSSSCHVQAVCCNLLARQVPTCQQVWPSALNEMTSNCAGAACSLLHMRCIPPPVRQIMSIEGLARGAPTCLISKSVLRFSWTQKLTTPNILSRPCTVYCPAKPHLAKQAVLLLLQCTGSSKTVTELKGTAYNIPASAPSCGRRLRPQRRGSGPYDSAPQASS